MDIKEPRLIFKLIGNKENDIYHTIKWLEDIHRNVEREWKQFLNRTEEEPPHPGHKYAGVGVAAENTVSYSEVQDQALFKKLTGLTNSEVENISLRASRIKNLFIRMRATTKMLPDQIGVLINKGGKLVLEKDKRKGKKHRNEFPDDQGKQSRRRRRDVIVTKMKTNKKQTNKEKKC